MDGLAKRDMWGFSLVDGLTVTSRPIVIPATNMV